jgi:2-polyprenyl-3-methyl-5-hydroxy-6-metoxy-1,4-benzoquinol methylase
MTLYEQAWENLESHLEAEQPCIVCGSTDLTAWASDQYLTAQKCQQCGMISTNPYFSEQGIEAFYANYLDNRFQQKKLMDQREEMYLIDRDWVSLFVKGGKVLDVGCSGGFFLSKFDPAIWDRHGIEIAPDAAELAHKHYNIPVRVGNIIDLEIEDRFDLVMMRGVIEHFRNPIDCLEKCASILKPGGHLFITATPAGDAFAFDVYREKWRLFTPLEHVHFFTVGLLNRILKPMNLAHVAHHYAYEETPYANPSEDFKKIQQDIALIQQDREDQVGLSGPFPGSMITALWKKQT